MARAINADDPRYVRIPEGFDRDPWGPEGPEGKRARMAFMAAYNIDRFREFVASEGFREMYDLPADELEATLADDVKLMLFGFRFLRQVLFGEESIPVRLW